jgi:glycerophosphoryl diester phosphodiesterase
VRIVAHRGAATVAPENTMAAFRAARDLGADGIELDVHATADGELVVLHDFTVDRTTDGTGRIFELPMAEVGRLDAGSWFGTAFAGEPVPRLSEVLALERLELEVELRVFTMASMLGALHLVEAAGALDRTEFTSWNTSMLVTLKGHAPRARIGLFSRRREPWMPAGSSLT